MSQYDDLPPGAEVVGYSDLPPGAEVVKTSEPQKYSATSLPKPPTQSGVISTMFSDIAGMFAPTATSPYGGMDLAAKQALAQQSAQQTQERKAAGYSNFYRAIAPLAQGSGLNVPGMEQDAAAGNQRGVIGHALAPLAAYGVVRGTAAAIDAIPTKGSAGAKLALADAKAGATPIDPATISQAAAKVQELAQSGGQMPKVVRDFIRRINGPKGPLTYTEARKFYSNASRVSADEFGRLTPAMQRELGNFTRQLGNSIQEAANNSGVGPEHASGMSEYRSAARLNKGAKTVAKYGAGALGGGYLFHLLSGEK